MKTIKTTLEDARRAAAEAKATAANAAAAELARLERAHAMELQHVTKAQADADAAKARTHGADPASPNVNVLPRSGGVRGKRRGSPNPPPCP